MQLYYKPGACSLSPHIVLREAGIEFDLERVDTTSKTTETGSDFAAINPKGYVPALRLDNGAVLTEGAAIVQYLADQQTDAQLAPKPGTLARARLQEHLNYIASELHKAFSPLFSDAASPAEKQAAVPKIEQRLDHFETVLGDGRAYLMGDAFTVADAYLFVVASWTKPTGLGLDKWPRLAAFVERVAGRDSVQAALRAEGLLQ